MINEKERKFLVSPSIVTTGILRDVDYRLVEQGYFTKKGPAVRICVSSRPYLTPLHDVSKFCIKGPSTMDGKYLSRPEFEYTIPSEEGRKMLALAPTYLRKYRWELPEGWEIDMVELPIGAGGDNSPESVLAVWIAEFELDGKRVFPETLPSWIVKEVTDDDSYSMRNLAWVYGCKENAGVVGTGGTFSGSHGIVATASRPMPMQTPIPSAGVDR